MTLIRRCEERAGEMYARAKVGGFLHLSIGEEATIVGSARALRDSDDLISPYPPHGHRPPAAPRAPACAPRPARTSGPGCWGAAAAARRGPGARCTCSPPPAASW